MTETQQLLTDYARDGSEAAFRELVRRYVDLVYSTAVRFINGDRHLAEDIAQTVFADLANSARTMPASSLLGGWLHRHTCFVASKTKRSERRRQQRERQAAEMNAAHENQEPNNASVGRDLDEAINELNDADRTAILLRFFEQRDFKSVGQALGGNEDAARMRVNRALGKLHTLLTQRGVTLSSTALAGMLATGAVTAAPGGLAASLATTALAGAAATSGLIVPLLNLTAMTKLQAVFVGAAVIAAATPLFLQQRSLVQARADNQRLQTQVQRMAEIEAENTRLSNLVAQVVNDQALSKKQLSELLKLRGEVGGLRQQLVEATTQKPTSKAGQAAEKSFTPEEYLQQAGIAKMNYTKNWMLAFYLFSEANGGHFPTNFNQALAFLPEEAKSEHNLAPEEFLPGTPKYGLTTDSYDILYQGSLRDIANPARVIVLREKEPWQNADGGWVRAYAFADGHSEIHRAADGNFEPWEAERIVRPPQ